MYNVSGTWGILALYRGSYLRRYGRSRLNYRRH